MATLFRWPGWDPLAPLRGMQRDLERLLTRGSEQDSRSIGGGVYPPVNVLNGPGDILVECEVAGLDRDDLDLSITGSTLTIKGTKNPQAEEEGENAVRYLRRERGCGDFGRTVVLPEKVDPDGIEASLNAGILTVRLPKAQSALPRKIEVK